MSRSRIITQNPNETFICRSCGTAVAPLQSGGNQRNHCTSCLCSLHVDILPGDRRSGCRGLMKPVSLWIKDDGEWALIQRCEKCGALKSNRIAGDDNELMLFTLAASPLAQLPFPSPPIIKKMGRLSVKSEANHD